MLNYFSNVRFQENIHGAKCKQVSDNVRKEIYKFEMNPLKNFTQSEEVKEKIISTQKNLDGPNKYNFGRFNAYAFCVVFTFCHLRGIRLAKKNLNEMDRPIQFCYNNIVNAGLFSWVFGYFFSTNVKNYLNSTFTLNRTKNLNDKFSERYGDNYGIIEKKI